MKQDGLRLDQAPPLSVPLRFFLTAPVFPVLAAAVLAWLGPSVFVSRWSGPMLALTHLMTLGFLALVMVGALMQLLPVLAGAPVPRPRLVSGVVHALLASGVLALGVGWLRPHPGLLRTALVLLGCGFAVFIAAAGASLWRARANSSVWAMRLALAALVATLVLGIGLLLAQGGGAGLPPQRHWTRLHLGWGLIGWVALLITGMAYQVVPMFQLTPSYPRWMQNWLAPLMFFALCGWTAGLIFTPAGPAASIFATIAATGLAAFAAATLFLQHKRRRRLPDVTTRFWRIAMASLLAALALWLYGRGGQRLELLIGVLMIVGFASSAVHGMLYKIVPFLAWLHLQGRRIRGTLPTMKDILPDRRTLPHPWIHGAAILALAAACLAPEIWVYPAAAATALSYGWLGWNLVTAAIRYRRAVRAHVSAGGGRHVA